MTISSDLIVETAQKTLEIEAQSIQLLKTSIDEDFVKAVQLIWKCAGRIVVTGIGKSALVGRKIVATLNSTGTPAIFMHAADAIHGDLGMIRSDDIIICISKSGETAEIKVLLPMLKHFGSVLIGMTSNKISYLGKLSDYILHTPVLKEADPNNLAPTASTTAQMAIGDALATALLVVRGFTSTDFAQYHPGGALGKKLYAKVCDIASKEHLPQVKPQDSLQKIIIEITSQRLGCTAVVAEDGAVIGIITDGDLRRMLEKGGNVFERVAQEVMTPFPKTIAYDTLAIKAMELMKQHSITQLIVLKGQDYMGIIHLHDLIREGIV